MASNPTPTAEHRRAAAEALLETRTAHEWQLAELEQWYATGEFKAVNSAVYSNRGSLTLVAQAIANEGAKQRELALLERIPEHHFYRFCIEARKAAERSGQDWYADGFGGIARNRFDEEVRAYCRKQPELIEPSPSIREAARQRQTLCGSDAQALEGALQQVERELAELKGEDEDA